MKDPGLLIQVILLSIIGFSLISCDKDTELKNQTKIHFIIANESIIDDSLDIKVIFDDDFLVDEIFNYNHSSTDFKFRDVQIKKGDYSIKVRSNLSNKERIEEYTFDDDAYWFLIFYWNPRGAASPDNEFHFTIHNDTIKVG